MFTTSYIGEETPDVNSLNQIMSRVETRMTTRVAGKTIFSWVLAVFLSLTVTQAIAKGVDHSGVDLQRVVDAAYTKYKNLKDGKNADYIPILATVPSDLFGVVIVTRDGKIYSKGDVDYKFSIQSVSKPFTASLVMQQQGPEAIAEKIGVEPTGLPFNSKIALELLQARSANPSVNAGAIAAVSMVKAKSEKDRWNQVLQNLSDYAGSDLKLMD